MHLHIALLMPLSCAGFRCSFKLTMGRLNRKRRWACEGAAGGEAFSGQREEQNVSKFSAGGTTAHEFIHVAFPIRGSH